MSLPANWVDRIFSKLTVTYGRAWLSMWEGVDIDSVKADWAGELSIYQQNPAAIAHALDNLPASKPPTVLQFREVCRTAPAAATPRLSAPAPNPEQVARVAAAAKALHKRPLSATGNLQWAIRLQERERRGPGLTQFQRDAWRDALKVDRGEAA